MKKIVCMVLAIIMMFSCLQTSLWAVDTSANSSSVLQSGVYRLKNVGSGKYLTMTENAYKAGGYIEQQEERAQSQIERTQLFKITYLGEDLGDACYSIRPMTNNMLFIGAQYPETNNYVNIHNASADDSFASVGEENIWRISLDDYINDAYVLKNKYMGDCYYEIYQDDFYVDNAFLCSYDDENGSIMALDFMEDDWRVYAQWQFIPYQSTLEGVEVLNPVDYLSLCPTYKFEGVAYSSVIGKNKQVRYYVTNIGGSAEIDLDTGAFYALSEGDVNVTLSADTIGSISFNVEIQKTYLLCSEYGYEKQNEKLFNTVFLGDMVGFDLNEIIDLTNYEWVFERCETISSETNTMQTYYRIKLKGTNRCLTSLGSGCALCIQDDDNYGDAQLWKIIVVGDTGENNQNYQENWGLYKFKIQSKTKENTDVFLAAGLDNTGLENMDGLPPEVFQAEYVEGASYSIEWSICLLKDEVFLFGAKETVSGGHDHIGGLAESVPHLLQIGYDSANLFYTPEISLEEIKREMEDAKVFISRSHGNYDSNGTYIVITRNANGDVKLHATDIYDFVANEAKIDMSNYDFALFIGCYTANHSTQSLPQAAVNAGADFAIGFNEAIICGAANDWTREFCRALKAYNLNDLDRDDVENAAQKAVDDVNNSMTYGEMNTKLNSIELKYNEEN